MKENHWWQTKTAKNRFITTHPGQEGGKLCMNTGEKCKKLLNQAVINEYSQSGCREGDQGNNRWKEENTSSTQADSEWSNINEVIESDFIQVQHRLTVNGATLMR